MRGDDVLAQDVPLTGWKYGWDLAGDRVQMTAEVTVADPDGALLTADPLCPLGIAGQHLILTGVLSTRRNSDGQPEPVETLPLWRWRIEKSEPIAQEPWRIFPNGQMVPGAQEAQVELGDLYGALSDDDVWPRLPVTATDTVRTMAEKIVRPSGVPLGRWTSTVDVPDDTDLTGKRGDALTQIMGLAGLIPWVSRSDAILALTDTVTTPAVVLSGADPDDYWGATLEAGRGALALIRVTPSYDREGIANGWYVTGETAGDEPKPTGGAAYEQTGPFRWGGPFGRVSQSSHQPLMRTDAMCAKSAQTQLDRAILTRSVLVSVECVPDLSIDPLDTIRIQVAGRHVDGVAVAGEVTRESMSMTLAVPREAWRGFTR